MVEMLERTQGKHIPEEKIKGEHLPREGLIAHFVTGKPITLELANDLAALGEQTWRETIRARYEPFMKKKEKGEPLRWAKTNFGSHTNLK